VVHLPRRRPDQSIPDDTGDMPANDELGLADVEQRRSTFWFPLALLILILAGAGYYFFDPHNSPTVRADTGGVTKSEPRPN
jgi:hypothetical protein